MKTLFLTIGLLIFSFYALAQQECKDTTESKTIEKLLFNATPTYERGPASIKGDDKTKEYRRGCCSWHGGVCGCSYGNIVCCDGQLSPSCGCSR